MIEINLIPDVKREFLKARTTRNAVVSLSTLIGIIALGLVVILGLAFGGQAAWGHSRDQAIKQEADKLMSIEDINKTVTIQQQLASIDQHHETKLVHSRLFDVIRVINPPAPNDVKIATLKLDPQEQMITVEGSAANGYTALENFKKTILNTSVQTRQGDEDTKVPLTTEIVAGDTSFGEDAQGGRVLRFTFSFVYPAELFAVSEHHVAVITPEGNIDVTDSKLGVPSSLFRERAADIKEGQ